VLLKVLYNGEWLAKLGGLDTAKIQQVATASPVAMENRAPRLVYTPKQHSPKKMSAVFASFS